MGFFDQLGKKASETYQVTKEKAALITEEIKIKNKIADNNVKINKLYNEIGKIVYINIKDNKDVSREEVLEKTEEISRINDDIEKLETDLLAVRKIKKCENCNEEIELSTEFCPKCGAKQPSIEKVDIKNESEVVAKEAENVKVNNSDDNDNNENNNN